MRLLNQLLANKGHKKEKKKKRSLVLGILMGYLPLVIAPEQGVV